MVLHYLKHFICMVRIEKWKRKEKIQRFHIVPSDRKNSISPLQRMSTFSYLYQKFFFFFIFFFFYQNHTNLCINKFYIYHNYLLLEVQP